MKYFDYITIIPVLTIVILIASVLASIYIKPAEFKKTRTSVFISIMGSAAVVILAFNVYLTSVNVINQKAVNEATFTKKAVDKLWLFPNQLLMEATAARPEFLASFYSSNTTLYELSKDLKTKPTIQSELAEQYISIVLFQCWEDYLTLRTLGETGDESWLFSFIQWARSPYLRETFDRLKYNYAPTTIKLAELLFEYGLKIPVPNLDKEFYRKMVKELIDDPKLKEIFKERAAV
jgi:hypothetical protein